LLAAVGLLTGNVALAAKVLGALLFGANVLLVGFATYLGTRCRIVPSVCAALLFASATPILYAHGMAWSEPAFFCFALTGLLVLAGWPAWPIDRFLLLAAASLSLAMITRYAGLVLGVPLFVAVFLRGKENVLARWKHAVIAFTVTLLPIGLWFV